MAEEKKRLRREMLARRDRMEPARADELNRRLWEQMERYQQLWSGMPVYTYISYRREADTRRLVRELWKRGIPVAAPRTEDGRMEFYRIRSESDLTTGYRGIPEPVCGCEKAEEERALVIVPGAVLTCRDTASATAVGIMTGLWPGSPAMRPWGWPMISRWCPGSRWRNTISRWGRFSPRPACYHKIWQRPGN